MNLLSPNADEELLLKSVVLLVAHHQRLHESEGTPLLTPDTLHQQAKQLAMTNMVFKSFKERVVGTLLKHDESPLLHMDAQDHLRLNKAFLDKIPGIKCPRPST